MNAPNIQCNSPYCGKLDVACSTHKWSQMEGIKQLCTQHPENHGYSLINDIRTTIESCKMLKMTYFGLVCGFGGTLA